GLARFEVAAPSPLPQQQRFRLTFRLLQWRWRLVAVTLPENIQNLLGDELAKVLGNASTKPVTIGGNKQKAPRRCDRSSGQDGYVFRRLGAERRPRIVDQCGEDVTQQIALRDNHVGAILNHSRIKLAFCHERRAKLIEIAVKPPMAPRPDLMHRSVP